MSRGLKVFLKVVGIVVILLLLVGVGGWLWLKGTFLNFEKDYAEQTEFSQLSDKDYRYIDRNGNGQLDPYEDNRLTDEVRVANLLELMTVEEKIHLLKGSGMASGMGMVPEGEGIPGAVGTIVPTPRLGLPTIYLSDGPAGLRIQPERAGVDRTFYATAFPIATLLSSTWNTDLVEQIGVAMGNEAKEYGIDVILGPGANIHRHPLTGRNFEYYSEDPLLSGLMATAMVNGIESNNIGTSVKHYVANNQETNRNINDSRVSQRALREIYLKGFELVVDRAQPWTIMSSYNQVNGEYAPESRFLLTDVLRDEWGFEGIVMSDWFGGQDAVAMVSAGNDLLEPGTKRQWKALLEGYEEGTLTDEVIDIAAGRILHLIIKSNKMDNYQYGNNPDLERHAQIARQSAAEGITLLKNDNALPFKGKMNVALLGTTSYDFIAGGTGSGDVNEAYTISLEQGLVNVGEMVKTQAQEGQLVMEEGQQNAGFVVNVAAKAVFDEFKAANADAFVKPEGFSAMSNPYVAPQIDYTKEQLEEIAASADAAIITIGRNAGEGGDRVEKDDFLLSAQEQHLIDMATEVFHAEGKKVIVVLNIGGVVETASWRAKPDAILLAWQGGQEGGNSVADVLAGNVSPSGKLPMTFPVNLNDHWSNKNFPLGGEPIDFLKMLTSSPKEEGEELVENIDYTDYDEGIYVGYRHFDKADLEVAYPFGFGLSYTTFELGKMQAGQQGEFIDITVEVTNTGDIAGKEVVQVYTALPDTKIDRAPQELKAFAKTQELAPGQSETLLISIPIKELSYWDESTSSWQLERGAYQIKIGTSSRDIKLEKVVELN